MTSRYVKLENMIKVKDELPKSRAKPDVEIDHVPNAEFTVENKHT